MRRSGVGCGPVHGGRTERLHLGRGPHVRRPPGDRREKKRQRSSVMGSDIEPDVIAGGTAPIMPHSSTPLRRRPCFLKIPQQGSGRVYCPHNPANSPALHVPNTEIFKAPPTLKRRLNSCSITASESFAFVLGCVVSPLSLLSSKLVCSFFFQPTGSV